MNPAARHIKGKAIFYEMLNENILNLLNTLYPKHTFNLVPYGSGLNVYTCAWVVPGYNCGVGARKCP